MSQSSSETHDSRSTADTSNPQTNGSRSPPPSNIPSSETHDSRSTADTSRPKTNSSKSTVIISSAPSSGKTNSPPTSATASNLSQMLSRLAGPITLNELMVETALNSSQEYCFIREFQGFLKDSVDRLDDGKLASLKRQITKGKTLNQLFQEEGADQCFILENQDILTDYAKRFALLNASKDDNTIWKYNGVVSGMTFGEILADADNHRGWLAWLKHKSGKLDWKDPWYVDKARDYFSRRYYGWDSLMWNESKENTQSREALLMNKYFKRVGTENIDLPRKKVRYV